MTLRLVCLLAVLGLALGDTVVLNQLVDQVIAGLDDQLRAAGKDQVHIEDLNGEFKYRKRFFKVSGHCNCHDGYARSLASLRRTGDVTMTTNANAITLRFALGLGQLEMGFSKCQLKVHRVFSVTERAAVSVDSNSLTAQITLVKNGNQCVTSVDDIHLDHVGRIKLKTGGSWLHKIQDLFLNWIVKLFHGKIVKVINFEVQKAAREKIPQFNLCDKIPH